MMEEMQQHIGNMYENMLVPEEILMLYKLVEGNSVYADYLTVDIHFYTLTNYFCHEASKHCKKCF